MLKEFTISYWVNPKTVNSATSMVFSPVSFDEGLNIADNWFGTTFPTVRIWKIIGENKNETYLDNWLDAADGLCNIWSHITLTCSEDGSFNLYVNGEIRTTSLAGGLLTPYKGLLPAKPKGLLKKILLLHNQLHNPPGYLLVNFFFAGLH